LSHTVLRLAARQAGLDIDGDASVVEVGTADKALAGLVAGSMAATAVSPPSRAGGGRGRRGSNTRAEHDRDQGSQPAPREAAHRG
jgi:hypothetical protein